MKIIEPTLHFEYFGSPLKIASILKNECIYYCLPGSAKNSNFELNIS